MTECVVGITTFASVEDAYRVAQTLVEERLAACVQVVDGMRSFYRFEGRVHDDLEVLVLIKTVRSRFDALSVRLHALHPYTTPELVALPVVDGSAKYLAWVREMTGGNG